MTYIEGFVCAVPTANKEDYIAHAKSAADMILANGARRMVENWGDDVPEGKVTDFAKSVQAKEDETVVFSWFEYPDRATRDAANNKMMADPRMEEMSKSMPFDGSRMIYAGFESMLDERADGTPGYTDGFVLPVRPDQKDAYVALAQKMAGVFRNQGALRIVEAWGDDVPDGKVTDYKRAVQAEEGENVVYSFIEWPDKATRDAGWRQMMENDPAPGEPMPFDGKRMFWGGFTPVLDTAKE